MFRFLGRGLFLVITSFLLLGCGPMWWNNPYGMAIQGYGPGYQPNAIVAEGGLATTSAQAPAPTAAPVQQAVTAPTAAATPAAGSTAPTAAAPVTVIMVVVPAVREPQGFYDDGDCYGPRFGYRGYGGWPAPGYFGCGGMYHP